MDGLQQPSATKSRVDIVLTQLQELSAAMDKLMALKGLTSSADPEKRDERRVSSLSRCWTSTSSTPTPRFYPAERRRQQSNGFQGNSGNYRPVRGGTRGRWTHNGPAGPDVNDERGRGRYSHNSDQPQ